MRPHTWLHSIVCAWTTCTVLLSGCRTPSAPVAPKPVAQAPAPATPALAVVGRPSVPFDETVLAGKLTTTLGTVGATNPDAVVTPLAADATAALLARMEPLPRSDSGAAPVMRPPSAPPPRSGVVAPIAFIAQTGTQIADKPLSPTADQLPGTVPLAAPQIEPTDEVRAESEIRVRFDEPMVAVAAVGTQTTPPATITPAIAGSWRWLDTRIAVFTAGAKRLPAATDFTIKVPAGTKALSGAVLPTEVVGTFHTTGPQIAGTFPQVALRPDSPLLVEIDQTIDPAAITKFLHVQNDKTHRKIAVTSISLDEAKRRWAKNPAIQIEKDRPQANYVILAAPSGWPSGMSGRVTLDQGAPSAEGTRGAERPSGGYFEVAPLFTVRGIECEDNVQVPRRVNVPCTAWSYLSVRFSNEVEPSTYRSRKVQIADQPFADNSLGGDYVTVETPMKVGGPYKISVGDGLVDVYGQPLVGSRDLSFMAKPWTYDPSLTARGGVYVLDPRFEIPQWIVHTQSVGSLHVELYDVEPADVWAYGEYLGDRSKTVPGKRVFSKDYAVGARAGAVVRVDLRPALGGSATGHVVAIATATPAAGASKLGDNKTSAWIQVTKLGLTARFDGERVNAWAHDITPASFLKPVANVQAQLVLEGSSDPQPVATTDANGHVSLELPAHVATPPASDKSSHRLQGMLLATLGTDSTFTTVYPWEKSVRNELARWYVTDDRFTYKPGEPVYIKGWVRITDNGVNPGLALPRAGDDVTYELNDARGNRITSGHAALSDQGGFDLTIDLPANINLGTAMLSLSTRLGSTRHPISVQEFRTPAYSVNLSDDVMFSGSRPLIAGESLTMSTEAKYYAGGTLAGSAIDWNIDLVTASYEPPGWDRYSFAPIRKRSERRYYGGPSPEHVSAHETTTLSGASTSALDIAINALPRHEPSVLTVDATVTDVDRQTIRASSRAIVVHPASLYVGARLKPDDNTDGDVQLVVTDIDGNAVLGVPIAVTVEGVLGSEWHRDDAEIKDTQTCKLTSARSPVVCHFTRRDADFAYTATATIADARGRTNGTQLVVPRSTYEDADLSVTPDRQSYKPGDTAKITIASKRFPGVAIVTFARNGVIGQKRVELAEKPSVVELPIEASFIENVHVDVDRITKRRHQEMSPNVAASHEPLPEQDSASIEIPVDLDAARLSMRTRPLRSLIEPGAEATFEVEVSHDDKPVQDAEVALMVVDEAVLAVSGKSFGDPLAPFYEKLPDGTNVSNTFGHIDDAGPDLGGKPGFDRYDLAAGIRRSYVSGYGYGAGAGGFGTIGSGKYGTVGNVVKARKDFRANAAFSPTLRTDAHGMARLTVKMPDSLTRYRIVAIAASSTRYFGKAESNIVAQRKVNARTVAPRFLTQGDTFELPVVVQNLDDVPRAVDVAVRAANLETTGPQGKRVVVPAGQRAEVRFAFATSARGKAVIQTIAVAGSAADSSNVEIPVYAPATTESFATYGMVTDKPAFERLAVPSDIYPEVGGVEAEVSSTQLQNLTDAYWYLYAYPFECAEQRSSRMLATTAMIDILDAFAVPGRPTKQELLDQRAFDLAKLAREQRGDGGWGYFSDMGSDPYVTMQVLTALAAQGDRSVTTKRGADYVAKYTAKVTAALDKLAKARGAVVAVRDSDNADVSMAAAGLSALAAAGQDVTARAAKLHGIATALDAYPIDAQSRVLSVLSGKAAYKPIRAKLRASLLSATHETAAAATVAAKFSQREERMLLVSDTKSTALALDALLRESPDDAVIVKLARGLLDARHRGRWASTQDNLFVLRALRRYFDVYEKETPSFTGKLWLGDGAYAEETFAGRSTKRAVTHADWATFAPGSTHDVTVDRTGTGRLYYRLGITYAPKRVDVPALDAGFVVRRTYRAIDNPSDVVQNADGSWRIKLGARVLVQIEALNTTDRYAVAIVDQLPAGFEAVNTALATAERAASDPSGASWDHVAMRDNRSEAFEMELVAGAHRFSYTARATTPGTFVAAPAKAEEMYSPETFGRSTGTTVTVQ